MQGYRRQGVCANHPDAPAIRRCIKCNALMCDPCLAFSVDDGLWCEPCGNALVDDVRRGLFVRFVGIAFAVSLPFVAFALSTGAAFANRLVLGSLVLAGLLLRLTWGGRLVRPERRA